ncbi:acetyltransferase [uncultured Planktosalinus sp.]|uniref:acetyltransferase n=1 Tax=uncultured Planktosalinus sp. TaxID=1810935 RepID=UPI0030DD4263
MLIVGAKGFAKEVLEVCYENDKLDHLVFYDDIHKDAPDFLYNTFPVLKSFEEAKDYFKNTDNHFTLGVGNPKIRETLYLRFKELGGKFIETISPKAEIGHFGTQIGEGCNILSNVIISNQVKIGKGVLVYFGSIITHDVIIEDFAEIAPGVTLLGRCIIGKRTFVGSNATILPDVVIGENVVIAAGAVVTKDVPDNCMVAGIPALLKKQF